MNEPGILPAQRRENPEPHESTHAVPTWLAFSVAALTVFGAAYIAQEPVDLPGRFGDGRTLAELRPAPATGKADGAALYAALCVACHQADGRGVKGVFPPLAGSGWVTGDPQRLTAIVLQGVSGPIEVQGETFNGAMPGFKERLDDEQLAALLTHLRSTWGNTGGSLDAKAVRTARDRLAPRAAPFAGGADVQGWSP